MRRGRVRRGITSDACPVERDTVPKDKKMADCALLPPAANYRKIVAKDRESVTLVSNRSILHFARQH